MIAILDKDPTTYKGQFGDFTIGKSDRLEVIIYRGGLVLAALSFAIATNLLVAKGESALTWVTPLYALFSLGLGISLYTIHPLTLLGIGFTFAALTGIYFKEAFCFNRLETKILTPIVPFLLLGHMSGLLSFSVEQVLLAVWTIGFTVFAGRKMVSSEFGVRS